MRSLVKHEARAKSSSRSRDVVPATALQWQLSAFIGAARARRKRARACWRASRARSHAVVLILPSWLRPAAAAALSRCSIGTSKMPMLRHVLQMLLHSIMCTHAHACAAFRPNVYVRCQMDVSLTNLAFGPCPSPFSWEFVAHAARYRCTQSR